MSQPLVPAASVHAEGPNGHTATPELKAACPGSLHASSYVALMGLLNFGHVHRHAEVCGCAGMAVPVHFHMHLHGCVCTPEHVGPSAQLIIMHMHAGTFMPTCISACLVTPYADIIPCAHTHLGIHVQIHVFAPGYVPLNQREKGQGKTPPESFQASSTI